MQRFDIINWLIEKYGYKSYLEIGVAEKGCWYEIECNRKVGIEPDVDLMLSMQLCDGPHDVPGDVYMCTSDHYFAKLCKEKFDIIFIDGEHLEAQVMRDIHNSLKHLSEGGTIVVHDCNPPMANCAAKEPRVFVCHEDGTEHSVWNGTTWKAWVRTRLFRKDLEVRCVDADWGCGIIRRGDWIPFDGQIYSEDATRQHLTYPIMALERENYLNLITVQQFKEIYNGG